MAKFYDTSSLLTLADAAFAEPFIISSVTLEELESIKTSQSKSEGLKHKARKVTRLLDEQSDKYTVIVANSDIYKLVEEYKLPVTADNLILACAKDCGRNVDVVYSEDLCMRHIGKAIFGLPMESVKDADFPIYTGCMEFTGDEDGFMLYMAQLDKSECYPNEYLIFNNTATGTSSEMRFDGNEFISLKLPPSSFIKGKTPRQRCALDMLMNENITICAVLGGYGSGKTYMATQMAFYNVIKKGKQAKILGVREPRGSGREIGYLKGGFEEKTSFFFAPIAQQIDGGQYMLDDYMRRGVIETNIPFYMKGTTYNSTVMIVDEAEDLTEEQIRLVGTRLGTESRVFFSGDFAQSVFDKSVGNPLVRMCNELRGNEKFACIYLDEDVRSETSKLFATLFK